MLCYRGRSRIRALLRLTGTIKRMLLYVKLTKGAMQGPLGGIGRHGDYLGDAGSHRD